MRILITGGGGFIGGKLARKLAQRGTLCGRPIALMRLIDLEAPAPFSAPFPVETGACDITQVGQVVDVFDEPYDVIFHLATIASGGSEAEFDLGMAVNLYGSMHVLEAARQGGNVPVVVFSSSVAVHGGEEPEVIGEGMELNPQTSYGAQKAMVELLLNDMTRKGFIDGRGVRLPTVTIRPGRPNTAASSFMSSIFREPLQGEASNCPVGEDFPIWHTAPRTVVDNIITAAEIDGAAFGYNRCLNLPGRTDTIGEMIEAMTRAAGPEPASLITWERDPTVEEIVLGWRMKFDTPKALSLGFKADRSFEDSVRWFLEDDIRR